MSGLSRTPGKRVRVNSPPRVRIPPSPPGKTKKRAPAARFAFHTHTCLGVVLADARKRVEVLQAAGLRVLVLAVRLPAGSMGPLRALQ